MVRRRRYWRVYLSWDEMGSVVSLLGGGGRRGVMKVRGGVRGIEEDLFESPSFSVLPFCVSSFTFFPFFLSFSFSSPSFSLSFSLTLSLPPAL